MLAVEFRCKKTSKYQTQTTAAGAIDKKIPKFLRKKAGGHPLTRTKLSFAIALIVAPLTMLAQTTTGGTYSSKSPAAHRAAAQQAETTKKKKQDIKPFSHIALGAGVSSLGVNVQAAVNVNKYLNLRGTGNFINYTYNNISANGFNVDAKLDFATAGASLDVYPFPHHGLRFSAGGIFKNDNAASATFTSTAGSSFTLDDYTSYSSKANPVSGTGTFGLHTNTPAFTVSTGWGNIIPRRGGHFSFPVELGVVFAGTPAVNVVLNKGQVCDANGANCVDIATNASAQQQLQAQINSYKSDLEVVKVYPILSFGVAYSFKIR